MFENCCLLTNLPDFSKWKLDKLEIMGNMFKGCDMVKEKPNIFNFKEHVSNNISSNEKSSNDKSSNEKSSNDKTSDNKSSNDNTKNKKKKKCSIF